MKNPIKKAFEKALEPLMLIVILAPLVWLKEQSSEASWQPLLEIAAILTAVVILYHVIDWWRGSKLQYIYPWLYTVDSSGPGKPLHDVERSAKPHSTIFLITPDLRNDARNQPTIDTVRTNLKKGICYVYVTRDNDESAQVNIDSVLQCFASYHAQIKIYATNEVFESLPTYNILIIDHDDMDRRRVFVELPVATENDAGSRCLWAEADELIACAWHRKLLAWIRSQEPVKNPYAPADKDAIANIA
jgi:hypothetical protein